MKISNCNLETLKKAGYEQHPKGRGYTKYVGRSRFHILQYCEENKGLGVGEYDLHFDKIRAGYHMCSGFDDQVKGEVNRINKLI